MKVIALKDYTDKRVSLYEGEIRNIGGTLATQLITKGVCSTAFPDDQATRDQDGAGNFFSRPYRFEQIAGGFCPAAVILLHRGYRRIKIFTDM